MATVPPNQVGLVAKLHPDTQLLLRHLTHGADIRPAEVAHPDPDSLLNLLDCHRLTTVFYDRIAGNAQFEPLIIRLLREKAAQKKVRMLAYMAELCRIITLLSGNNVAAISLKGPVLSRQYYDDYTLRECNDLDILVKPDDVETAHKLLSTLGYTLSERLWNSPRQASLYRKTFHHLHLINLTNGTQIELHWKLHSLMDATIKTDKSIWNRLTGHTIGGVPIQTLSRPDTFIYLCVHGSSHQWKRLFWVYDIARIIDREGAVFLEQLYRQLANKRLKRHILEGCHLAHIFFATSLPDVIHEAIRKDQTITTLSRIAVVAINQVSRPAARPLASTKAFLMALKKIRNHYQSTYYLGGLKATTSSFNRFFIDPANWRLYSFSDSFFVLNYVAAPFLWAYNSITKAR